MGDAVWYLDRRATPRGKCKKFLPRFEGPYFIVKIIDDVILAIKKDARGKTKVVHHDQVKPYHTRENLQNGWVFKQRGEPPPLDVDIGVLFEGQDPPTSRGEGKSRPSRAPNNPRGEDPANESEGTGGGDVTFCPGGSGETPKPKRAVRRRKPPDRLGDWVG